MFLSRIALNNVRSVAALELDFCATRSSPRRWTLLLGESGCGKSTVLKAIALLLAGSDGLVEWLGDPDSWIRNGASHCRIEGTLRTARGELRELALVIERGDTLRKLLERNHALFDALDAARAHKMRNTVVLAYGACGRPAASARRSMAGAGGPRNARAQGLANLMGGDGMLVSLEDWAIELDGRGDRPVLAALQQALRALLPGLELARIDRATRQLVFKTADGEVPMAQLGDSDQIVAAWCGDLLFRITQAFPDLKDPLAAPALLLIDGLDAHLHPVRRRQWQEVLRQLLPKVQFVATSLSALTAQQSGAGELYVLRREGLHQPPVLVPFVGEPRKLMLHQLLMSPMFGLDSLDSVEVERARGRVRELSQKDAGLTAPEKLLLQSQKRVLQAAGRWDLLPAYALEQNALLQDIKHALAKGGKRPGLSPEKLRATARAAEGKP